MGLAAIDASTAIWEVLRVACSLTIDGEPLLDETGNPYPADTSGWPDGFATGYDDYASAGVVPGASNSGGDKSILANFMASETGGVTAFATALANYWATVAVDPGSPAHGGVAVAGVVNDAASQISAFEAGIQASITTERSTPYYYQFVNNIQTISLPQVTWFITEVKSSGGTATYPDKIS